MSTCAQAVLINLCWTGAIAVTAICVTVYAIFKMKITGKHLFQNFGPYS